MSRKRGRMAKLRGATSKLGLSRHPRSRTVWFSIMLGTTALVAGQTIGEDLCACAPPVFNLTFDFSRSCPPTNVDSAGLASSSCLIGPFGDPDTSDFVPVLVTDVTFVEIGQDSSILVETSVTGNFVAGSIIEYESVTNNPERIQQPNQVPRALRATIIGSNANGEGLVNVFILTYNNNCSIFPVIRPDDSAGWAVFVSFPHHYNSQRVYWNLAHCHTHTQPFIA